MLSNITGSGGSTGPWRADVDSMSSDGEWSDFRIAGVSSSHFPTDILLLPIHLREAL